VHTKTPNITVLLPPHPRPHRLLRYISAPAANNAAAAGTTSTLYTSITLVGAAALPLVLQLPVAVASMFAPAVIGTWANCS